MSLSKCGLLVAALVSLCPVTAGAFDAPREIEMLAPAADPRDRRRERSAEQRAAEWARVREPGWRWPEPVPVEEARLAAAAAAGEAEFRAAWRELRGRVMGHEALVHAVARGHREAARVLLAHGADVDHRAQQGERIGHTPLTAAVQRDDPLALQMLLRAGARLDRAAANGATPLALAIQLGRDDLAIALIDAGAPWRREFGGRDALLQAAHMGRFRVVAHLLERGADIDRINARGATAIGEAFRARQAETVRLLLARGADTAPVGMSAGSVLVLASLFPPVDGARRQ